MHLTLEQASELQHRVPTDQAIDEKDKAVFYSSWYFSAIRLATGIDSLRTEDELAARFDLPREKVRQALEFLCGVGLCEEKDGKYFRRAKQTHLEARSPLAARHHANWRLKAMQAHEKLLPEELSYTAPITVAAADVPLLREKCALFIEEMMRVVRQSNPDEALMCLNLDWFRVK